MKKENGIGLAALILGIIAIITSFTIVLGIVLGIISLIMGIVAIVKKYNAVKPIIGIILSVISIIISIVMIFVYNNLWQNLSKNIEESMPIRVFIKDSSTDSEISRLKNELSNIEYVNNVTFVSKEGALEEAKKQMPESEDLLGLYTVRDSPFKAYFKIVLTDNGYREYVIDIIQNEDNQSFDIIQDVD